MSKELEALARIKKFYPTWRLSNREAFNIVEKALKALEIIKENIVVSHDESENDASCLTLGVKVGKDKIVIIYQTFDKEKIDLLKEVLL